MSNNPFSINPETQSQMDERMSSSATAILPVGVTDKVAFSGLELETSSDEHRMVITVSDASGRSLAHRIFGPGQPRTKDGESPQEAYARIARLKRTWFYHFCGALMPKDRIRVEANDWNSMCAGLYKLMLPYVKADAFIYRVLLEYNYRGFVSFPDYPPFIQHQTDDEQMDYEGRRLRLTRPERQASSRPSGSAAASSSDEAYAEDLPF